MKNLIAERIMFTNEDPARTLTIRLGAPERNTVKTESSCNYEIIGAGEEIRRAVFGLDAFQALTLSFIVINAEIASIEKKRGLRLRWSDGENDLSEL